MFSGLDFFKTASALAAHATQRQGLVARNVANADTPGYAAQDLPDFGEAFRRNSVVQPVAWRVTRPQHLAPARVETAFRAEPAPRDGNASPNGNSVSLESEMIRASEVRYTHDLAVTTYRNGLDLLRTALGRGR